MVIEVASGVLQTMRVQAEQAAPLECCGLLFGRFTDRGARIERAVAAPNVADDPARRFEIDPAALLAAHKAARAGGPDVVGYYHSHPVGGTAPSATDRAMAAGGGRIWAIIAQGRIAFWRDGPHGFAALGSPGPAR